MDKRPLSQSQRAWLVDELKVWQTRGAVQSEQVEAILGLYELPQESAARQQSLAVFALRAIALLFVAFAVLLLIGYNWQDMPAAAKLIVLFGALLSVHGAAFFLRYRRAAPLASELLFFLGCLLYGAAIWLIAQIFHLNAHYPDGLWFWAVGVLPFALALDTLLLHALLTALLAIWIGTEILEFAHFGLWLFGRWSMLPNGCYTLPLLAGLGLLWAYRKSSPFTVALYVALMAWWTVLQPFAWRWEESSIFFIGSVGGLLMILAEIHRPGSPFAIPYRLWGVLLALGTLIPLSYYGMNQHTRYALSRPALGLEPLAIFLMSVLVLGITLAVIMRRKEANPLLTSPLQLFWSRQWLPLGLVVLMMFLSLWAPLTEEPLMPTVLANVAMIASALWLIGVGLREDRGRPFAAGVLYLLLWAILRYIDLFGELGGMLGGAGMFLLCGVALFGISLFWRQRKQRKVQHV